MKRGHTGVAEQHLRFEPQQSDSTGHTVTTTMYSQDCSIHHGWLPRSPPISLCTWHLKCSSSDGRVCPQWGRPRFDPWVRKVPWRRKGQPTLVFLPGKSHGQRSLVGYTPQGRKELDVTEQLTHTHKHFKKLKMLFLRRLSPWLKLHEQKNLNTANYWAI